MPAWGWLVPNDGMQTLASNLNSPQTTTSIVIVGASLMTVLFVVRFWFAWRSNNRVAASMGGFTPTESSLARSHAVMLFVVVFGSMALAIGAVLSPAVRDALAAVGEHSRVLRLIALPFVAAYLLWLRIRIRRSARIRSGAL